MTGFMIILEIDPPYLVTLRVEEGEEIQRR
jgi:hypothetical protein